MQVSSTITKLMHAGMHDQIIIRSTLQHNIIVDCNTLLRTKKMILYFLDKRCQLQLLYSCYLLSGS